MDRVYSWSPDAINDEVMLKFLVEEGCNEMKVFDEDALDLLLTKFFLENRSGLSRYGVAQCIDILAEFGCIDENIITAIGDFVVMVIENSFRIRMPGEDQ